MEFSKRASASSEVPWQGTITYTIVLTNTGPDPETNIIMTDVLPANVSFGHWVTQPAGTVSDSAGITWTGTLTSGTAMTWTLAVTNTGSGGTSITNTARYSSTTLTGSAAATFSTIAAKCYPVTSGSWSTAFGTCPAGAKCIVPAGFTITLDVDVTLDGDFEIEPGATFIPNGKTVTLDGSAAQTLTGSPLPFYKLVINKTNKADKVQIVGKLAVSKKLTIAKGTLVSASEYGDLEIEGQGVITLTNPISVTGSFTNSGELYTQGHAVNFTGGLVQPTEQNLMLDVATSFDDLNVMTGTTLIEAVTGDNGVIVGTLANYGVIRKTQPIAGAGLYHFGLAGSKDSGQFHVDVMTAGSLTLLQVDRVDVGPANAPGATPVYWHFTPTGAGFNVTLTLPQNGLARPGACRRVSGSVWNCGRSAYSATTVTRAGVAEFSDWAAFELQPVTAVLAAEPGTSVYGQPVTFTTTVASPGAECSVQFYVDGAILGTIQQVSDGKAAVTADGLAVGLHSITATILINAGPYLDGEAALNGGLSVNKSDSTTALTSYNNPIQVGATLQFGIQVSALGAAAAYGEAVNLPTGEVTITDESGFINLTDQLADGRVVMTAPWLPAGTYTVTASYGGSDGYAPSNSTALVQVVQPPTGLDPVGEPALSPQLYLPAINN